jgi:hypothetical protein
MVRIVLLRSRKKTKKKFETPKIGNRNKNQNRDFLSFLVKNISTKLYFTGTMTTRVKIYLLDNGRIHGPNWRIHSPNWRIHSPNWRIHCPNWRIHCPNWRIHCHNGSGSII